MTDTDDHQHLVTYESDAQVGRIELAAHPFRPADEPGRVIQLDDWRRSRD